MLTWLRVTLAEPQAVNTTGPQVLVHHQYPSPKTCFLMAVCPCFLSTDHWVNQVKSLLLFFVLENLEKHFTVSLQVILWRENQKNFTSRKQIIWRIPMTDHATTNKHALSRWFKSMMLCGLLSILQTTSDWFVIPWINFQVFFSFFPFFPGKLLKFFQVFLEYNHRRNRPFVSTRVLHKVLFLKSRWYFLGESELGRFWPHLVFCVAVTLTSPGLQGLVAQSQDRSSRRKEPHHLNV